MTRTDTALAPRVRCHEAGHAAVALHQGFVLQEVSVGADARSHGRVIVESHPAGNSSPTAFWDKLVMTYAGAAAEKALLGDWEPRGARADLEEAQQIATALEAAGLTLPGMKTPATAEVLLQAAEAECATLMRNLVDDVTSLASALEVQPKLSGEDAAEVLARAAAPGLCQTV